MQILSEEPPSLSARFDFRNTFKLQRTIDYLVKFITIRAQHNYFKVDMLNSFTEKTFEENNIIPTFINSEWNAHKKDMITYAFWRQC